MGDQFTLVCRLRSGLPLDRYMTKENVRSTKKHEQNARVRGERNSSPVNLNAGANYCRRLTSSFGVWTTASEANEGVCALARGLRGYRAWHVSWTCGRGSSCSRCNIDRLVIGQSPPEPPLDETRDKRRSQTH